MKTNAKRKKAAALLVPDHPFLWLEQFFGYRTVFRVIFDEEKNVVKEQNIRLLEEFARQFVAYQTPIPKPATP